MKEDTSPRTARYFASIALAKSSHFDEVLELGEKLVSQLQLEDSVDTLGRWMAHHIAELIVAARNAPPEQTPNAREQCAFAIMELWAHRSSLSLNIRPFSDFEAVFRVLGSLDPENEGFRYLRSADWMTALPKDSAADKQWIEAIDGIDKAGRALTRFCLAKAVENAAEKAAEWVELAEALGQVEPDVQVVRIIIDDALEIRKENPSAAEIGRLKSLSSQLQAFNRLSKVLAADIDRRLNYLQNSGEKE